MALISQAITSLFGGVSQQPATLRLPSQHEAMVNAYPSVVDGVLKRPPFQHVARFRSTPLGGEAFLHSINRDSSERYLVIITNGDLKVYDTATGVERVVNFPEGKGYLSVSGLPASQAFAVVSIADYSFVVNKTVTVATKAAPTSYPENNWYTPPNWQINDASNPIRERYFNVTTGTNRGTVQTFEDLPNPDNPEDVPPAEGDWYKIQGGDTEGFASYYAVYRGGVWKETFEFGNSLALNELTMPWALVRQSDGEFSLQPFAWTVRQVGDDATNPAPSFVGQRVQDVFYYKNRLGLIAGENVIFSGAGDFGSFWRNTVVDLLDSDVVDAAVSSQNVSNLKFAVPFNRGLMLFADQTQFALNVDQLLTPRSVSIDTATSYAMSTRVRPVGIGQDVYFVSESGNYSRVRQYYVQEDALSSDAIDVTAHVPRYIPPNVHVMAGSSNEDVLFLASDQEGQRHRVWCYKFFWSGDQQVQSAWSYWELAPSDRVVSLAVIDNELYAVIDRADGSYIERCDLQSGATPPGLSFDFLVDRRAPVVPAEMSYSESFNLTTITLKYPLATAEEKARLRVVLSSGEGNVGRLVDPSSYDWLSDTQVRVLGDIRNAAPYVGLRYDMSLEISEQFVRNGDRVVNTGRFMLRTFIIYYSDTAFFSTVVSPYGTDPLEEEVVPAQLSAFTGKTLGSGVLITGSPVFDTGKYAFQIYGDSTVARIQLRNTSHVQSRFQSAEIEGFYHNRARPL